MKYPERSEIGRRISHLLGGFAAGFLIVLLLFLCGCVACPAGQDALCPTFPNAMPRQ